MAVMENARYIEEEMEEEGGSGEENFDEEIKLDYLDEV